MEAKKSHDLPSVARRTEKVGDVIQSELEGLRTCPTSEGKKRWMFQVKQSKCC